MTLTPGQSDPFPDDWLDRLDQPGAPDATPFEPDGGFDITLTEDSQLPSAPPLPPPIPLPPSAAPVPLPALPRSTLPRQAHVRPARTAPVPAAPAPSGEGSSFLAGALLGLLLAGGGGLTYLAFQPNSNEPRPRPQPGPAVEVRGGADLVVCERSGPFYSVADALARAEPGKRVVVKPGVYRGRLVIDRAVTIVGDGPKGQIVLEGASGDAVVFQADGLLRGVTVRGRGGRAICVARGRPTVEDCDLSADGAIALLSDGGDAAGAFVRCRFHDSGTGAVVSGGARPAFTACVFEANSTAGLVAHKGGRPAMHSGAVRGNRKDGIVVGDGGGQFDDVTVSDNGDAGLRVRAGGAPYLRGCRFRDCLGDAVCAEDNAAGTLEGCEFVGNRGVSVAIARGGNPLLRRCRFRDNLNHAVRVTAGGKGVLQDCTITAVSRNHAAIRAAEGGAPSLRDCTITGAATTASAVEVVELGSAELIGCTVSGHRSPQLRVATRGALRLVGGQLEKGAGHGVLVGKGGRAELIGVRVAGFASSGVYAQAGRAALSDCTLTGCQEPAVVAIDGGAVRVVGGEIFGNAASGVYLERATASEVYRVHIHDNRGAGVRGREGSRGVVRDNHLPDNVAGPLDIAAGCSIQQAGNVTSPPASR